MEIFEKTFSNFKTTNLRSGNNRRLSMIDPLIQSSFESEVRRKVPMMEVRPLSSFTKRDEYIEAMVEDLCDWLNFLYKLENETQLTPSLFFQQIRDGVILNKHANVVQYLAENYIKSQENSSRNLPLKIGNQIIKVPLNSTKYVNVDFTKKINSFHMRDNVANFIQWCRNFNIPPGLTFETDDLIMQKNLRNVVVCLLEIARIGGLFGMEVPDIIQFDQEIDNEMCNDIVENKTTKVTNECENKAIEIQKTHNQLSDVSIIDDTKCHVTMRKKANKFRNDNNFDESHIDVTDTIIKTISSEQDPISMIENCDKISDNFDSLYQTDFNDPMYRYYNNNLKIDNSDNESINSHNSQYMIPKYKTSRPVGRVKIYDCFDKNNFVKDKKYREKCDMRSLDERVREILSECQCSETFPMKRISEGKYQWGDKKTHIFVRILRNHVMVRVGGGWDTLNEFLRKHDHCRKERLGFQKPLILPQIRKPIKLSATCPDNLKLISQISSLQSNNTHTDYERPQSVLLTQRRSSNINFESRFKVPRSISCINHTIEIECQEKTTEKSDNKENSSESETIQQMGQEIDSLENITKYHISENQENNKSIQSNQKLCKYISKIPVLKKR